MPRRSSWDRFLDVSTAVEAIERAREAAQDHGAQRFIRNNADAGILGDCGYAACRDLLGYLSDIAHATDLDGVLAEISALQCALGGE